MTRTKTHTPHNTHTHTHAHKAIDELTARLEEQSAGMPTQPPAPPNRYQAPLSPDAPARVETIDKLIEQLTPHGLQNCITHAQNNETIDEIINKVTTSDGLYRLFWLLAQKAKHKELGTDQQTMIKKKAHTAVDNAMHLLAIEKNLGKNMRAFVVA